MEFRSHEMKIRWMALPLALTAATVQVGVSRAQSAAPTVTVYKSPTCGCCSKWIEHMRSNGFEVKSTDVQDMTSIKTANGVPVEAGSCHTALVGGYVLEGHVPADSVKRLLREKPKVAGLAVPGMPAGSPGMEVPSGQVEHYDVVSFVKGGATTVFDRK
jgi:hypothetical protein